MITLQAGTSRDSAPATARPSSPGISMSSRATSGWCWRTAAMTSSPRPTSATTVKSLSRASNAASAERMST